MHMIEIEFLFREFKSTIDRYCLFVLFLHSHAIVIVRIIAPKYLEREKTVGEGGRDVERE